MAAPTPAFSFQPDHPAIGRLNHAGLTRRSHCTTFLIGPKTVVTARHCIRGKALEQLHVVLGYERGEWLAHRRVTQAHRHENRDLALLCLDRAVTITPFGRIDGPGPNTRPVTIHGYPRSSPHRIASQTCAFATDPTRIRLECLMEPGYSGSPVFAMTDDGPRVSGVISGTARSFAIAERTNDMPWGFCG